jgi:hypothetical protein
MPGELPPPPQIDPSAPLIARTERIVVDRTPRALSDWMIMTKLEDSLLATKALPGVIGTTLLTPEWGVVGARRLLHLSDGGSATEQILAFKAGERLRYQVWNYTTSAARPIHYAIGEFRYLALDEGRTDLVWTYAFSLRSDRFPGFLGPLGRWLLKVVFLDRAYGELMRKTLRTTKVGAEGAA